MPRPVIYTLLILAAISWIPLALIVKARVSDSQAARIQVIPDMDSQPKFKTQTANSLFADGRAMRPVVAGTQEIGARPAGEAFESGKSGEEWLEHNPLPVTMAVMERGKERFGVYCAPCHGLTGAGDGMVSRRADRLAEGTWTPPTDLGGPVVADRADGHLFNTLKYGIRNMPAYGSQISTRDRWAIVAYLRALQRSRQAGLDDVPPDVRPALK